MDFKERKVYENPQQLLKERKQLFQDAIRHDVKPKRVPILSHAFTWKAFDAGYNLKEYFYDYEKRFDAVCQHHEKYEMDSCMELGTRNMFQVSDLIGGSPYIVDENQSYFNVVDEAMMDEDEYEVVFQDGSFKFRFERGIAAKHGLTREQIVNRIAEIAPQAKIELDLAAEYTRKINDQFINKFGVPSVMKAMGMNPPDNLSGHGYRGMAGFARDMRRQPDNVKRMLDMIHEQTWPMTQKILDTYNPEGDDTACVAMRMVSLSHTLLSKDQFGKYSWPYMKRFIDEIVKRNWTGILFLEGAVQHIIDYLKEIPEGHFGLLIEKEDPVKLKKQLPNATIIGGYPSNLLYAANEQQCIDAAKRIIDEAAYDGNYIFTTDAMLSYPEDGKGANMKAVVDFVKEYGKY